MSDNHCGRWLAAVLTVAAVTPASADPKPYTPPNYTTGAYVPPPMPVRVHVDRPDPVPSSAPRSYGGATGYSSTGDRASPERSGGASRHVQLTLHLCAQPRAPLDDSDRDWCESKALERAKSSTRDAELDDALVVLERVCDRHWGQEDTCLLVAEQRLRAQPAPTMLKPYDPRVCNLAAKTCEFGSGKAEYCRVAETMHKQPLGMCRFDDATLARLAALSPPAPPPAPVAAPAPPAPGPRSFSVADFEVALKPSWRGGQRAGVLAAWPDSGAEQIAIQSDSGPLFFFDGGRTAKKAAEAYLDDMTVRPKVLARRSLGRKGYELQLEGERPGEVQQVVRIYVARPGWGAMLTCAAQPSLTVNVRELCRAQLDQIRYLPR